MRKFNYHSYALLIMALAFACADLSARETGGAASANPVSSMAAPPSANVGRLIIRRAANLGTGLFLDIDIDGASVGSLAPGESYRGALSAGQHVISVLLRPNQLNLPRTRQTLTVESGRTYTFTAMWQGGTVVLR
jgi:hypothetical protein